MDLHTLFFTQTCALLAIALTLWLSQGEADGKNGMRVWTYASVCQAAAFLVFSAASVLPTFLVALIGNALGALSVSMFYVAICNYCALQYNKKLLILMIAYVTIASAVAGYFNVGATFFTAFAFAGYEWLSGLALSQQRRNTSSRILPFLVFLYWTMGTILPLRAIALAVVGELPRYNFVKDSWQVPLFVFGFIYIIAKNLSFALLCKIRAEEDSSRLARTDKLTGLPNRRDLDEHLAFEIERARRSSSPFAVVIADLDKFKSINDNFGHAQGDATLVEFSRRIKESLRTSDKVFRYGGEEFCVLLFDATAEGAEVLARRLQGSSCVPARHPVPQVTVSMGVTLWQASDTAATLLERADRALYLAKESGRNRTEFLFGGR